MHKKRFTIEGDDEYQSVKWQSLLKEAAFYFDTPTIEDENKMRKLIQRNYDDLLPLGWRAPLTSRRDLLTWSCNQANASFEQKGFPKEALLPCEKYNLLLKSFGPDYDGLKTKLGFIRGLFD